MMNEVFQKYVVGGAEIPSKEELKEIIPPLLESLGNEPSLVSLFVARLVKPLNEKSDWAIFYNMAGSKTADQYERVPQVVKAIEAFGAGTEEAGMLERCLGAFMHRECKPSPVSTSAFKWVAKACSKDKTRERLTHVFVESGTMVATDGRRLHAASTELEDGYHHHCGESVPEMAERYPKWQQVIPDMSLFSGHVNFKDFKIELIGFEAGMTSVKLTHPGIEKWEIPLNYQYLRDAVSMDDVVIRVPWSLEECSRLPVVMNGFIKGVNCMALVMPLAQ